MQAGAARLIAGTAHRLNVHRLFVVAVVVLSRRCVAVGALDRTIQLGQVAVVEGDSHIPMGEREVPRPVRAGLHAAACA